MLFNKSIFKTARYAKNKLFNNNLFSSLFGHISDQLIWKKIYLLYPELGVSESNELKVLRFLLKTNKVCGQTFLDIGSCRGGYAFALSNNFSEVVAFEPDLYNFNQIQLDIRLRRKKNVTVIRKAVSNIDGEAKLYKGNDVFKHSLKSRSDCSSKLFSIVGTVSLNSFVKYPIDLVKVDVQGVVFDVIKGAEQVMAKIKRWVVELEFDELDRKEELCELMESFGYKTVWLSNQHLYAWR